jgi:translation initiation factor 1
MKYRNKDANSQLVFSTDQGEITKNTPQSASFSGSADGVVRIQRESKGRGGKTVSVIQGLAGTEKELKALLKSLKGHCGCGGALKNGSLEIQGDNRDKLKQVLEKKGYTVKLAGG